VSAKSATAIEWANFAARAAVTCSKLTTVNSCPGQRLPRDWGGPGEWGSAEDGVELSTAFLAIMDAG